MGNVLDWQAIVSSYLPGNQSTARLLQDQQVFFETRLLPDIYEWARQEHLVSIWGTEWLRFRGHAYVAACTATGTLNLPPYAHTWLVARYILWIFAFDHYLDHTLLGYVSQQHWSVEMQNAYLDHAIVDLSTPLYNPGGLTIQQARLAHLPVDAPGPDWYTDQQRNTAEAQEPPDLARAGHTIIKQTLTQIYRDLLLLADGNAFAISTFTYELASLMGVMHREAITNLSFQCSGELPDIETYLSRATTSIGMKAGISLLLAFGSPEEDWQKWYPALTQASRIVRLINDCATDRYDQTEGKVNSVMIMLAALGNQKREHDQRQREEAIESLRQMVIKDVLRLDELVFTAQGNESALRALGHAIVQSVAVALYVYQSKKGYTRV